VTTVDLMRRILPSATHQLKSPSDSREEDFWITCIYLWYRCSSEEFSEKGLSGESGIEWLSNVDGTLVGILAKEIEDIDKSVKVEVAYDGWMSVLHQYIYTDITDD